MLLGGLGMFGWGSTGLFSCCAVSPTELLQSQSPGPSSLTLKLQENSPPSQTSTSFAFPWENGCFRKAAIWLQSSGCPSPSPLWHWGEHGWERPRHCSEG